MPPTNDFVPFCPTDTGSNLLTQVQYLADPQLAIGNQPGVARSKLSNKALRQATYIASCVAQFLSNVTGDNVLDDENQANVLATMAKVWPAPTGTLLPFAGSAAPTGFLLCQGQSLLRASYPALFAVIGTTYGSADGTHFTLPDTRGVFLRGGGTQTIGGINYTGTPGTAQGDTLQGHWHTELASPTNAGDYATGTGGPVGARGFINQSGTGTGGNEFVIKDPSTDGTHGTPRTGAETAPANISVNYIIKT